MKQVLVALLMLFGATASANEAADVIGKLLSGEYQNNQYRPGPGPGERPYPGRPGRPGRPYPPPGRPGYGQLECIAVDAGHEEHWGGHRSCGECLARHDNCIESCDQVVQFFQCEYEGRDRRGYRQVFQGRDEFRRRAEEDAYYQCSRSYRDCRFVRCDRVMDRQTVSRGACDRWGRGPGRR